MNKRITYLRKLIWLAALAIAVIPALYATNSTAQARNFYIAAVVNDEIISGNDLADRMKLVMSSSGLPNNADIRAKITPQILRSLIEERLKQQEAERNGITITEDEIDQGFANIAGQNKLSGEQFASLLRKEGVSVESLREQIKSEILWGKIIKAVIRPQITISDNELDAQLARLERDIGKTEYRLFEIFLAIDEPDEQSNVRKLASQFHSELSNGRVPFQRLASQVSQSSSAARGGDLGWVQEGQLPPEIETSLRTLDEKELSNPIHTINGYYIVFLLEKRLIKEENIPSRDDLKQKIGFERLDRMARQYLLDLKADSFIEQRV